MKKTFVVSVPLKECRRITDKAHLIADFNGHETIVPSQFVVKEDYEKSKEDAERWWIAEWILKKKTEEGKGISWGNKRTGWYNPATHRVDVVKAIRVEVEHHIPSAIEPDSTPVQDLAK